MITLTAADVNPNRRLSMPVSSETNETPSPSPHQFRVTLRVNNGVSRLSRARCVREIYRPAVPDPVISLF